MDTRTRKTVRLCLELTEALQTSSAKDIDKLTLTGSRLKIGRLAEMNQLTVDVKQASFDRARTVRARLINPNIQRVHRYLDVDEDTGKDRSYSARLLEPVYWHLANVAEGGVVRRCKRPGCGALFTQRHRSQEYCAPRWGQRESPCALWVRQRRLFETPLQRIATRGKTGGNKTPQVPVRKHKKARQSAGRNRRA